MTKEQIERNRIRYGEVYDKPDGDEILGFPMPVIEAMLRYQENQGNPRNITIFKNRKWTSKNSGGFDWTTTKEGDEFWDKVISNQDFDVFFEEYPELLGDPRYLKSVELYGEENLLPNDVELMGDIAGMPSAIVKKMTDEQLQQGNESNATIFIRDKFSVKSQDGFTWGDSKDGAEFWGEVLRGDYELFFEKYPELLPEKGVEEASTEEVVTEEGLSVDSFIEKNKEALQDISKTNTPLFNALNGVLAELRISYEDDAVQVEEVVEVEEDELDLDNLMGEIDELDLDSLLDEIDDLDDL